MNFEQVKLHLKPIKNIDQILDAAKYLIHSFNLEHENFAGFGLGRTFSHIDASYCRRRTGRATESNDPQKFI
jgi:hypothetical protein